MITYSVLINNILHGTIKADSRTEAVAKAHEQYKCAGIHLSKVENWVSL